MSRSLRGVRVLESIVLVGCALVSAVAIRIAIALAPRFKLIDQPGEHKAHEHDTPFVGGIGVFVALSAALLAIFFIRPEYGDYLETLALAALIMFATGFLDDVWRLGFRIRFVVQALAAIIMVMAADVVLRDLGGLFFNTSTPLGVFAIPFTIFATVGVINALNMIDGMDGLAGSIAFMSLLVICMLAFGAGHMKQGLLCVGLLGGIGGFLYFNLRYRKQRRARVFMGDNGSMLLGVVFAWLLIDMSQGEGAVIKPVTAIWLFAVPLFDTVGVMMRRIWLGKSPFTPDRNHLHHLLLRAGYRVEDVVAIMALLQLFLAACGVVALSAGVSEGAMFFAFLALFAGYFYVTARPWRVVPAMRRMHGRLGLMPATSCGIYIGNFPMEDAELLMEGIALELEETTSFRIRVFEHTAPPLMTRQRYALVDVMLEDEQSQPDDIQRYSKLMRRRLREHRGIYVRPVVNRSAGNDPRGASCVIGVDHRRRDRRDSAARQLVMEASAYVSDGGGIHIDINDDKPHGDEAAVNGLPRLPRPARGADAGAIAAGGAASDTGNAVEVGAEIKAGQ